MRSDESKGKWSLDIWINIKHILNVDNHDKKHLSQRLRFMYTYRAISCSQPEHNNQTDILTDENSKLVSLLLPQPHLTGSL